MSDPLAAPATPPLRSFTMHGIRFFVYATPEDMGAASAHRLAHEQVRLAARGGNRVGFLVMAAPSAYAFYSAYLRLARHSESFAAAVARTDFFQFDEYPLPETHPASFRFLLETHFYGALRRLCPLAGIHPLNVDAPDPLRVCRDYAARVLAYGPDLQLKGVGENGHWGFHEPGIPLDGEPVYMKVRTSDENAAQQLRDHPALFRSASDVPREAYSANVPLFLRTREAIEDNVPQASKAFALLAAYGSAKVDTAVPTSALKRHPNATVRTTEAASWAIERFARDGRISTADVTRLAASLGGAKDPNDTMAYIKRTLDTMEVAVGK